MSRSNPTLTNPARKFFKWRGSTGDLVFYDKESEEEMTVPRPFRFVVLDRLSTIKGYNKDTESSIWSNEIRNIKTDVLSVKMKGSTFATGQYDTIKNELKAQGGKYTQSVYVAYQQAEGEDGNWIIGNINFGGSSLGSWIDFSRGINVERKGVGVVLEQETSEEKNGATKFFVPTFDTFETSETDEELFDSLDQELQGYLKTYLVNDEKPDWQNQVEVQGLEKPQDVVIKDIEDKPIDLSEIPF